MRTFRLNRRFNAGLYFAAVVLVAIAGACLGGVSDPNAPAAIQVDQPQLPSLVKAFPLTDTLGHIDSLHVTVFDGRGNKILSPPVRFFSLDTLPPALRKLAVDSVHGTMQALDTGSARVVAEVEGLQTQPIPFIILLRPDTVIALDSLRDSLDYTFNGRDTTKPLSIELEHLEGGTPVPIGPYRVEYHVTYPPGFTNADSSKVLIVDDASNPSLVDTTDATGTGTRSLLITTRTDTVTDSLGIDVRAFLPDHTAVPGSPVHYQIRIRVR